MRFATWNIRLGGKSERKLDLVQTLGCDLVALQEVSVVGFELLRQSVGFKHYRHSLPYVRKG